MDELQAFKHQLEQAHQRIAQRRAAHPEQAQARYNYLRKQVEDEQRQRGKAARAIWWANLPAVRAWRARTGGTT